MTIDPGQKSGWVSIVFDMEQLVSAPAPERWRSIQSWETGETWGPEPEQAHELALLATEHPGVVLIEDFILRKMSSDRELLAPVRVTARFEQQIWMWNEWGEKPPVSIYKQPPSAMYGFERELHKEGLWSPGMKDANQAGCHTLHFLRRLRTEPEFRERVYPKAA